MQKHALRPSALMYRALIAQRADMLLDVRDQAMRPAHDDGGLAARLLERASDQGADLGTAGEKG